LQLRAQVRIAARGWWIIAAPRISAPALPEPSASKAQSNSTRPSVCMEICNQLLTLKTAEPRRVTLKSASI